jgi:hypothetical protein
MPIHGESSYCQQLRQTLLPGKEAQAGLSVHLPHHWSVLTQEQV